MKPPNLLCISLLLTASVLAGCSSSSPGGTGGSAGSGGGGSGAGSGTAYCSVSSTECIVFKNVVSTAEGASECGGVSGTVVGSCPSSGLSGCCSNSDGRLETCYYKLSSADAQNQASTCKVYGSWSTSM